MYYFPQPEVNFLHNGRKFITTLDLLDPGHAANTEVRCLRTEVIVELFFQNQNALLALFRLDYLPQNHPISGTTIGHNGVKTWQLKPPFLQSNQPRRPDPAFLCLSRISGY